jgi:ariadne-1
MFFPSDESEDDIDMDGDDFKVSTKGNKKSYEVDYESLSQRSVEKLMQRDVDHICGIFGVEVCLATFPHFEWLSDLFHARSRILRVCCCGT